MITRLPVTPSQRRMAIRKITVVIVSLLFLVSTLLSGCASPQPTTIATAAATAAQTAETAATTATAATAAIAAMAAAKPAAPVSYRITLDINPSIDLTITDGLVTAANAWNDDGAIILESLTVIGLSQEAALDAIIKALKDGSYFSTADLEPRLVVTVANSQAFNEVTAEELKHSIESALEKNQVECKVNSALITAETIGKAAELQVSAGRYMLLEYIAAKEGITVAEAKAKYGFYKIAALLEAYEGSEHVFEAPESDEDLAALLAKLPPEQQQALLAAMSVLRQDLKTAVNTFIQTFKTIKSGYVAKVEALKPIQKTDPKKFQSELKVLKESVLSARRTAITVRQQAFAAAKATFMAAVAGLGLPADALKDLAEEIIDDIDIPESFGDLDELVSELDDEDKDDEDEDEDEDSDDEDEDEDRDDEDEDDDDDEDEDEKPRTQSPTPAIRPSGVKVISPTPTVKPTYSREHDDDDDEDEEDDD